MAEAGIAAYGAAIGMGLLLAVVAFSLRQRRPPFGNDFKQN